jgi:hypothetical protein
MRERNELVVKLQKYEGEETPKSEVVDTPETDAQP